MIVRSQQKIDDTSRSSYLEGFSFQMDGLLYVGLGETQRILNHCHIIGGHVRERQLWNLKES